MRAQMDQADAPETPLRGARSRAWIGRAAFEAALIVFGLVGALLIDEWRDTRERNERVRAALASIDAELEANRAALQSAIANHDTVIAGRPSARLPGTRRGTLGSRTNSITPRSSRLGTRIAPWLSTWQRGPCSRTTCIQMTSRLSGTDRWLWSDG
jgi:hypothetical protein